MNRNIEINEIKASKCIDSIINPFEDINKVYNAIRRIISTEYVINGERSIINLRNIKKYHFDDTGVYLMIEKYKMHRYHHYSRKKWENNKDV